MRAIRLDPFVRHLGGLGGLDFFDEGVMRNTQVMGDVPASLTVDCPDRSAAVLGIEPGGARQATGRSCLGRSLQA